MHGYIVGVGTAVPDHCLEQAHIAEFMIRALALPSVEARKLRALYRSTKIQQRHSVLADYGREHSFEFYPDTPDLEPFPTVSKRMEAYRQYALPLALKAIASLRSRMGDSAPASWNISHLITVSCTGLYAPGLDIELVEQLGLSGHVQRTAINFMGCYGAFNGIKVANAIVKADPTARVLLVCIELCTLHFQKKWEESHQLSNALFADGAAAVLIQSQPQGISLALRSFYCDLLPQGRSDMAWHVADFGFEMVLTSYVAKLLKSGIKQFVERLKALAAAPHIDYYAIHPGGKAILEAVQQELGIDEHDNRYAYQVLRQYGNMSSCTVLFVLKQLLEERSSAHVGQHVFSCAFGPGLTLEAAMMQIVEG